MIENLFTFVRTLGNQRIEGKKFFVTQVGVLGTLSDYSGSVGTAGQILSSTATGVEWVDASSVGATTLNGLTDVTISTALEDQILVYNGSQWVNTTAPYLTSYGSLDDLSNVNVPTPLDGQVLTYDSETNSWIATTVVTATPTLHSVTTAGNTTTNTITVGGATSPYFLLDIEAGVTEEVGMISWDNQNGTARVTLTDEVSLQVGQEQHWYVKNMSGATIPNGTVVMAVGAEGASGHIRVAPMIADGTVSHKYVLGVVTADIANGFFGYATTFGKVRDLDTSMFAEGAILYCDPLNAGGLTDIQPVAPNLDIPIAFVVRSQASTGVLAVRVNAGFTLGELHDVDVESAVDGNVLTAELDGATNTIVWKPKAVPSTDKHYTHNQSSASATWTITHNLGKNPSISAVDSAGTEVIGEVYYVSLNQLIVYFTEPFSGKAYLN